MAPYKGSVIPFTDLAIRHPGFTLWLQFLPSPLRWFIVRSLELHNGLYAELCSAWSVFWFGLWLLLPMNTMASAKSWDLMRFLVPQEWAWGLLVASLGVAYLYRLYRNQARQRIPLVGLTFCLWVCISLMFGIANFPGVATVIYPIFAMQAFRNYIMLAVWGVDHGNVE
jgi:hypothetical protein